jgi:hypothetical protein
MERLPLSNDAVFPLLLWTGTRGKTSKLPRITKCGQEPNGMKLSSNAPLIKELRASRVIE